MIKMLTKEVLSGIEIIEPIIDSQFVYSYSESSPYVVYEKVIFDKANLSVRTPSAQVVLREGSNDFIGLFQQAAIKNKKVRITISVED